MFLELEHLIGRAQKSFGIYAARLILLVAVLFHSGFFFVLSCERAVLCVVG